MVYYMGPLENYLIRMYGNIDNLTNINNLSIKIKLTHNDWFKTDVNDLLIFYSVKKIT